jgi:hypothetical protein
MVQRNMSDGIERAFALFAAGRFPLTPEPLCPMLFKFGSISETSCLGEEP